ncbi:MAG: LmeA family phospholipid-binding protein [Candidatus Melainabacteria bacterium]
MLFARHIFPLLLSSLLLAPMAAPAALAESAAMQLGTAAVDLPDSTAQTVRLELDQARFSEHSVGKLILSLKDVDFRQGQLSSLGAELHDGQFDQVVVDAMNIDTDAFSFDTFELLNHRRFVLDQPITGRVSLSLSEDSLNRFITNPRTLKKLEDAIKKQTGGIKLVTFSNPSIRLYKDKYVQLAMNTVVAGGVVVPMQMQGKLGLKSGNLQIQNLELTSEKNQLNLPVDVVNLLEDKLNDLINLEKLGKKDFIIHADSMSIKKGVIALNGSAKFTRLSFGKD